MDGFIELEPTMDDSGRTLELALMVWVFLSWLTPWTTTGSDVFLVVVETVVEAAAVVVAVVEVGVVAAAVVVVVGVAIVVETVAEVVEVVTVLPKLLTIAALLMGESAATEFLQGVAVFGGGQGL